MRITTVLIVALVVVGVFVPTARAQEDGNPTLVYTFPYSPISFDYPATWNYSALGEDEVTVFLSPNLNPDEPQRPFAGETVVGVAVYSPDDLAALYGLAEVDAAGIAASFVAEDGFLSGEGFTVLRNKPETINDVTMTLITYQGEFIFSTIYLFDLVVDDVAYVVLVTINGYSTEDLVAAREDAELIVTSVRGYEPTATDAASDIGE